MYIEAVGRHTAHYCVDHFSLFLVKLFCEFLLLKFTKTLKGIYIT